MSTELVKRGEKLVKAHRPAVSKAGWLPEGLWPELDDCREAHESAVARVHQALSDAGAIGSRFKAEDEARVQAYKTGLETPTMTDPAARESATSDARAKLRAAEESLAEAVASAVATLEERGEEWMADLEEREGVAEAKRIEAARLLAEAESASAEVTRTRQWVGRSSGLHPRLARLGHIPFAALPLAKGGTLEVEGPLAEAARV